MWLKKPYFGLSSPGLRLWSPAAADWCLRATHYDDDDDDNDDNDDDEAEEYNDDEEGNGDDDDDWFLRNSCNLLGTAALGFLHSEC